MTAVGEVLFLVLVVVNIATIVALGWPWTYQDRGVSWNVWLTAWSAVLFDGTFLFALLLRSSHLWIRIAFLLALSLRVIMAAWLLWMVAKKEDRNDWTGGREDS